MKKAPHQDGLLRENTGKLQSLWLETPGRCNLACRYCFACGGENLDEKNLLQHTDIEKLLNEAREMGVKSFGIPGAGEPLLPINKELTMYILKKCATLGFFSALFTTGEFITPELADELYRLPVELLIKCNALNVELQDKFVSDPKRRRIIHGYGKKRNNAIEMLMANGFNQPAYGRKSRLALVTSIMTDDGELSNLDCVVEILRFCRQNNIIFDCDSVLKVGRGINCGLHTSDEKYKQKLLELQKIDREEFGNEWLITQSYVGGPACDRYRHHLYVTQYGEIHP
ncbi:MAG: tungsten-containing aldehyde ferredoxin oxidoreductase cofactor modifying protein, partial [uncultured bacterium]